MSKMSRARNSAKQAAIRASGSHLTRRNRAAICDDVIIVLYDLGYQVEGVQSLRVEHIVKYIEYKKGTVSVRTLQNKMSAIRVTLRQAGRVGLANHESISNRTLGIDGASHAGTNYSVTKDDYECLYSAARENSPELAAGIELMRCFGLRALEMVSCDQSLNSWRRTLLDGSPVHVVRGTKGGRPRWVIVANPSRALAAVESALKVLRTSHSRHLFSGTLKQALGKFHYRWCRHCRLVAGRRITPHSLRYTYAQEIEAVFLKEGYSKSDARALTAMCLGHGDGRGRLMKEVYGRRPPRANDVTGNILTGAYKNVVYGALPKNMGFQPVPVRSTLATVVFPKNGNVRILQPRMPEPVTSAPC